MENKDKNEINNKNDKANKVENINRKDKTNQKNDKKCISLWHRFWLSITGVDQYYSIAIEGAKRSVLYICILTLIMGIIVATAFVVESKHLIDDSIKYISSNISNFKISMDGLQIESNTKPLEVVLKRVNQPKIIIDTETAQEKNEQIANKYDGNIIIFEKENILLKIDSFSKNVTYKDVLNVLGIDKISKSDVLGFYNEKNNVQKLYSTMSITLFIYFFIEYFITSMANIIALSLVGIIVSRTFRMKFRFSGLFSMATAAITLPNVLTLIYTLTFIFTGFTMKNFSIMTTIISYIYIIAAIINIYRNLVRISEN